jgi:CHASE2 domain-containing sensor protein
MVRLDLIMWSQNSPLPLIWLQMCVIGCLVGIGASLNFGSVIWIPIILSLVILMFAFNAFDLKMDKGQYSKKRKYTCQR